MSSASEVHRRGLEGLTQQLTSAERDLSNSLAQSRVMRGYDDPVTVMIQLSYDSVIAAKRFNT